MKSNFAATLLLLGFLLGCASTPARPSVEAVQGAIDKFASQHGTNNVIELAPGTETGPTGRLITFLFNHKGFIYQENGATMQIPPGKGKAQVFVGPQGGKWKLELVQFDTDGKFKVFEPMIELE